MEGFTFTDCPALQQVLVHKTFLEELVFWTVKFEFPQKVVCLLLNMLPDPDYKVSGEINWERVVWPYDWLKWSIITVHYTVNKLNTVNSRLSAE